LAAAKTLIEQLRLVFVADIAGHRVAPHEFARFIERKVLRQTPAPHSQAKVGTVVVCTLEGSYDTSNAPRVALQPARVSVPPVTGLTLEDARARVEHSDLEFAAYIPLPVTRAATVGGSTSSGAAVPVPPADYHRVSHVKIARQEPPHGALVNPKSRVACFLEPPPDHVARTSSKIPVPPVVGKRAALAEQILKEKNLHAKVINDPTAGPVQRSEPGAGQMVDLGTTVALVFPIKPADAARVSSAQPVPTRTDRVPPVPTPGIQKPTPQIQKPTPPPPNVSVPALLDTTFEEARIKAQAVGLSVEQQQHLPVPTTPTKDPGKAGKTLVTYQSIKEHTTVPKGTTIKIQLARYVLASKR